MNDARDELAMRRSQDSESIAGDSPLLWISSCMVGAVHSPLSLSTGELAWYVLESAIDGEAPVSDTHR